MGNHIPVQIIHEAKDPSALPAYVSFSSEIMPFTTESLIALLSHLSNQGVRHVYLMISTPGGSFMHGMNLYNVLRAFSFKLTTHNVGNVDSIGNAIFLAGEERFACPHSTFMFHGVTTQLPAITAEAKSLRKRLDAISGDIQRSGNILVGRTRIRHEDVSNLFGEASTQETAFAVGGGIVHEVRDSRSRAGASVSSLMSTEAKFLRERLDAITGDIQRIGNILVERTRIKQEEVNDLFGEASTKDAAFAVGCGIVHEVRDVKIPVGASVFSLVFQR